MSSRTQPNPSRTRKPRDKRTSRQRDHSQDSVRSETEPSNGRFKGKEDARRKEVVQRTRTSRSPRKGRENKEPSVLEKSTSSRNLSGRKDDSKARGDNVTNEKSRELSRNASNDRHALFQDSSRLSQLIGQLTNAHDDHLHRIQVSKQFGEYVRDSTHIEPIKRNCNNIFSALEDVFKERGHNELKDQVILCLGSIGQLLGIDCDRFFKWVFSRIPNAASDQLRALYLRTVHEAMKLDLGKQTFYDAMPKELSRLCKTNDQNNFRKHLQLDNEGHSLSCLLVRVMASLQDVLENADAPELLLVIMDIISIIGTDYPDVFEDYFKDIVDILVGWHIDTTQSENLVQKTSECLVRFHSYWIADMGFSLTLLSQFIEDMEAYAEELKNMFVGESKKGDSPSPFKALPKLNSLVNVYTTVVKGIGEFFAPGRGCPINATYINETVTRIIQCVDITCYDVSYPKLLISANDCLREMTGHMCSHFSAKCDQVAGFMMAQLVVKETLTFKHLKSILSLLETMVTHVGVAIPQKVIQLLFDLKSPLYDLRHTNNNEVYLLLLKSFQSLLSIKNIPIVETAYRFIVDDLTKSYGVLKEAASAEAEEIVEEEITDAEGELKNNKSAGSNIERIEEDKELQDVQPTHEAYASVIFDLSVIAEIATYKSSVVGAWKVNPPTFELLTKTINPLDTDIGIRFPAVQFCLVCTLYTHAQRCNHFLHVGNTKGSLSSPEFKELMNILCSIVAHPSSCADSRKLCLVWLSDIVNTVQGVSSDLQRKIGSLSHLLDAQISSSYSSERSVVEQSAMCLQNLLKGTNISEGILPRALIENLCHLVDLRDDIRESFMSILLQFPTDLLAGLPGQLSQSSRIKQNSTGKPTEISCKKDIWLAKKCHMARPATGTLRSHHFKVIMGHILQGLHSKEDPSWIEDIYHACQRLGKITAPVAGDVNSMQRFGSFTDSSLPKNAHCSEELLWFWATWEAAQFCLLARLKTPLGKAMETFQSIEGVLKELERNLRGIALNSNKSNSDTEQNSPCKDTDHMKLRQSMLLLQFLENLEKQMYNAFEGSAVSLPQSMRAVRNFFRTNRATCQEWLSRIRESASRLACLVGCPAVAIRHGFAWLQGLKESGSLQGAEFERAVVVVVDSLCQLHAWESVNGILEWCKKAAGRNFFWLTGVIAKSKGCLEKASEQFRNGLERYLSPDRQLQEHVGEPKQKKILTVLTKEPVIHADSEVTSYLSNQALDCYMKLGDWNSVQQWSQKVREMRQRMQNVEGLHAKVDMNYVKAMMKFEDNDFPGVREQLELIPGATISNILQEQFPVLGTVKDEKDPKISNGKESDSSNGVNSDDTWKPSNLVTQSQMYLMQALTLYWTSGLNTLKGSRIGSLHSTSWETVEDLFTRAKDSLMIPMHGLMLSGCSNLSAPYLMQLKSLAAIRETLFVIDNEQERSFVNMSIADVQSYLDPNKTEIEILTHALRAASYLQFHHSLHKKGWVAPTTNSSNKMPGISSLQVLAAKLSRKQGNIKLAESLLAKQLFLSEGKGFSDGKLPSISNANLRLRQLSSSVHTGKVADPLSAVEILRESAKLKRVLGHLADSADTLCSSIILAERQHMTSQKTMDLSKLSEISARSVLTLVQWLLADPKLLNMTSTENDEGVVVGAKIRDILKIVVKSGGLSMKLLQNASFSVIAMSECDKIGGQLLHFSTHRCPSLSKTWYAYAEWCYKWGRKAVEHASVSSRIDLLDEEKENVLKVFPEGTQREDIEGVLSILNKAHCSRSISPEEDISTTELTENVSEDDEENTRRQLLLVCPHLLQDQPSRVASLLSIWRGIIDRVFSHYKQASAAYFTYLRLGDSEDIKDGHARSEYGNITATLRLLRLLVKYSGELKQELEVQLDQTPTRPWKGIIPQLFARLNHPEFYVQKSVASLLCRIAKDFPHLIIYPTVVGCSDVIPPQLSKSSAAGILRGYKLMDTGDYCDQPQVVDDDTEVENEETDSQEEQPTEGITDQVFQGSLHTILDALSNDNPSLVSEVKTVVKELRRITLLWDELWIGSLMQLNHEAQRRIQQLCEEIQRVNANQTLSAVQKTALIKEKHSALMKPLVYSLERLEKITNQAPETKHEENFQKCFGITIKNAIEKLKMPVDPSDPQKNWEPLKELYGSLHARTNRRSMSSLAMEEISPVLAKGKFSHMPMPGIDFTSDNVISLESFANEVLILPTKTKPKKLVMVGSDGQRYTYLFKGLEDLHLDERITQFLEICNHMFAKEEKSNDAKYIARRYSVTPLGSRSGLIQWVDGATPIFALYKRWQQREIAAQNLAKASQGDKSSPAVPVAPLRPSELFYNKITPLLKEKGINDLANTRKEWPITIFKKVFAELSNETPSDLLAKELWCASTTASDWWEATQTYSRSVAVMSIIGYIIGLGDRHLDNILVDLSTGEVVHIDYNVCFEKGKALRVSEKVPFRMTRNIEMALGVTGVEGLFRLSCEKVLQMLRHGRETLLTLLEAFVYDPLVDWTTANDGAFAGAFYGGGAAGDDANKYSKKEMERGITQTLLSTRVAEMNVSWTSNRDDLLVVLAKLENCADVYGNSFSQQQVIHREMLNLQHQHNLLKAALDRVDHPLHSLQARYDKQAKLLNDLKAIKLQLEDKTEECKQYSSQHKTAFSKVRGKEIGKLYTEICKLADIGTPSYGPAASFLQSAGQANIISQCEQMEAELVGFLNQRRAALRSCLDTLFSYAAVVIQFPDDYDSEAWCSRWIPWLERIISDSTSETCCKVLKEHDMSIQKKLKSSNEAEEAVVSMEGNLHQYFTDQNSKLVKLIERRNQEPLETVSLSGPVTETWNAVRKFIGEAGVSGATSLACVTITALTTLNKRYLVMENAAAVSGERLMHLTSRDGDWFLDELCTMCGNIAQLLSVLKNNPLRPKNSQKQETLDHINNCMQVLFASVKAYGSFQELMTNFKTIIVPEALKGIQNEEDSVKDITRALHDLITECPMSLQKIVERLQSTGKEKSDSDNDEIYGIIDAMRDSLHKIIEPEKINDQDKEEETEEVKMSPGQMLLAGFSGLFAKVESELSALYDAYRKLQPLEVFEHLELHQDQKNLKTSKEMTTLPFGHCLSLLFARRMQVMDGFFEACTQQAAATRDLSVTPAGLCNGSDPSSGKANHSTESIDVEHKAKKAFSVFNEDLLSLPVKQFIAECVQQFVVGLPSQSLTQLILYFIQLLNPVFGKDVKETKKINILSDDLCKKAVEQNLKTTSFTHQHLNKASGLIHAHDVAWRKHDLARRLESAAAGQKDIVQRAQLQLARFQWLHEEILCQPGKKHGVPMASPSRTSFMGEIKKRLQAIGQIEYSFPNLMERYSQLQSSIEQRLKWAAGANPALNTVQQNFEKATEKRKQILADDYSSPVPAALAVSFILSLPIDYVAAHFMTQNENNLTPEVTALANSIFRLETFRSNTQDAVTYDAGILSIVQKCKECCEALEANTGELGDVEQLMNNLQIPIPPKEPITVDWMKSRLENADKKIKTLKTKERNLKSTISNDREAVKSQVQLVKNLLTGHNTLVGDVKSLLKTLAKDEEAPECGTVRVFITTHNKFSEDASAVLKGILQLCSASKVDKDEKERCKSEDKDMIEKIKGLTAVTNWLHDQLLAFGSSSLVDAKQATGEPQTFASALRNQTPPKSSDSTLSSSSTQQGGTQIKEGATSPLFMSPTVPSKPAARAPSPKRSTCLVRDPKTGKAMQEKNLYAVNVWRRVKAKLEGRDLDINHRMTVCEQVDHVIKEATNIDNLCQLYEGWTPWV